ncbi:uncharacterized protein LOC144427120 isoform X1 [Styela clava]
MRRVAVIGAGVSGLCAAKHLLNQSLTPVVYEMTKSIGGIWEYDPAPSSHCSIYESLVTNQPKQIMELSDHKFPKDTPTFLSHKLVLEYLKSYCDKFNLTNYIKFGHKVELVTPIAPGDGNSVRWKVELLELESQRRIPKEFDYVLICNGHNTEPNLPLIPGEEFFCGEILHSGSYRRPQEFGGKDVLLLGSGPSGVDIALDVAKVARHVYLSHKISPLTSKLRPNIYEMPNIERFNDDGESITFIGGETKKVSVVIYCTGYLFNFPFLDENCGILYKNNHVTPLYKHIVNINYNSMLFIGIPVKIPVFKILDLQVAYAAALVAKKFILPPKQSMLLDEENDFNKRIQLGWPGRHAHVMSGRVFKYADYLSHTAGVDCIPENIKNLYDFILDHRKKNLCSFKSEVYRLNENNEWQVKNND